MGKTYDIGKKSDMRKLARDLEKSVKETARREITRAGIDVQCPGCGFTMHTKGGDTVCPKCGKVTDVTIDWSGF